MKYSIVISHWEVKKQFILMNVGYTNEIWGMECSIVIIYQKIKK
jgi:hypothetical protein